MVKIWKKFKEIIGEKMNKTKLKEIMDPILKNLGYKKFNWEEIKIDEPSDHKKTRKLDENEIAVYMFKYGKEYLKIGKVGENSNPRLLYQHYNPNSCKSNLAKQLIDDKEDDYYGKEWKKLRKNYIENEKYKNNKNAEEYKQYENARNKVGKWIRKHTSRTNIYLNISDKNYGEYKYFILSLFESALQCKYKPRYENNIHEKK